MIHEPGDANHEVPVNETFHEQTDDELTEKERKQVKVDDQAIQTILLGLPKDIYAAVDSCERLRKSDNFIKPTQQADCLTGYKYGSRQTDADGWRLFRMQFRIQAVNQNGLIVVPRIANQNPNGNGNVVAARAEGNVTRNNGNKKQAWTSSTQTDKTPIYDSDGLAELLEPIPEPHQVQQNDSNVISEVSSVEQDGGTVDQHLANVEETHAYFESLYNNLAIEVENVNSVNRKMKETNADLTIVLARYKNQEKCFEISQEKYDKLE
nr:hypothetical protein [Tanacetum cinerariifolium]